MKLDRNLNADGHGKYMLFLTRRYVELYSPSSAFDATSEVQAAINLLMNEGLIEDPPPGDPQEFFVFRLKDRHSRPALIAYADSVRGTDPEFAAEIDDMAARAGELSPFCKEPD